MTKRPGVNPLYSQLPDSAVIMRTGDHRIVRDSLDLKFGLEQFACRKDGRDRWLPLHRTVLRDDLLLHMRKRRVLPEAQLLELARNLPPYVGGPSR